jgi:bifunctional UDP-N-acetylglucosamine pyrophosphorylase/glucosamine-1-phosphate N-acetyltransferase
MPHRIFLYQPSPKGTGDVLRQALKVIPRGTADAVYFFCGDKPLLKPETVRRFRQTFAASEAKMMFLVGRVELPPAQLQAHRQGRVVQIQWNGRPEVMGILEHSVLTTMRPGERKVFRDRRGRMWTFTREQLLAIREVNVSTYAWRGPELWDYVEELRDDNPQGEFFVTDLVAIYRRHGHWVSTMGLSDAKEGWGIDTVEQWWRVRDAS